MRICILVRIFWTAGAQKIAISEAKTLQSMGHSVKLIFLRGKLNKEYADLLEGVSYVILSETGRSLLTPLYRYISSKFMPDRKGEGRIDYNMIRAFPHNIGRNMFDLILCHDQWAGLGGYYANRNLGTKYSVVIHEKLIKFKVPILGKLATIYERKVLSNATTVYAVSNKIVENIKNAYGISSVLLVPGINKAIITPFVNRRNQLLTVSFWDGGRYPEIYLNIIDKLEEFNLVIAGNWRDSYLKEQLLEKIKVKGLKTRVRVIESLTETELIELYKHSKFLVRFGFDENGPGMANLEAISYGLPTIVNDSMGVSELVRKYNCGTVVDGEIVDDLLYNRNDWYSKKLLANSNKSAKLDISNVVQFIKEHNNAKDYSALQDGCIRMSTEFTWINHCKLIIESTQR